MNPRDTILGEYVNTEPILLQQENDDPVMMTTIEDFTVENLQHRVKPLNLDYEVGDADPEDEFLCNDSSSDDEATDDEEPY